MSSINPQSCQSEDNGIHPVPKALHYIIIGSIVPALAFGIPHALLDRNTGAAMGVPLVVLGGLFSLYRAGLFQTRKSSSSSTESGERYEYQILLPGGEMSNSVRYRIGGPGKKKEDTVLALVDLVLGLALLSSIILTLLQSAYMQDAGMSYIAAYASLPMIVNGSIHAFLLFHYLYYVLNLSKRFRRSSSPPLCSNCQAPMCEATGSPVAEPTRSRQSMESVRSVESV